MDRIVEEEAQQLEKDLYKKDHERILELNKPNNDLGTVLIRMKERVPEDLKFRDSETYALVRSNDVKVPAFQKRKRMMINIFNKLSEEVIDTQILNCRQRHIQQKWRRYVALSERQRFTSGYEAQGKQDIKYNKREIEVVTAYYLKQYIEEEAQAFEQVSNERTRYKRKEMYAHWFAKRGVSKRAPRPSALKHALKDIESSTPTKTSWDNVIPCFFKRK